MKKLGLFVMPLMAVSLLASCKTEPANIYTVTFNSNNGSPVFSQTIDWEGKATKPNPNPTKQEDDFNTYLFDNWYEVDIEGKISDTAFDFDTPITKNIDLIAKWTATPKIYKANATNGEHLTFTTIDDKPITNIDITAGKAFTFEMKASTNYKVPSSLKILVGTSTTPLADGYSIKKDDETNATVTIDGNKVSGNLSISGEAVRDDYYYEVTYSYGVKDIIPGTHDHDTDLVLTFIGSTKDTSNESYTLPKAENVYILFDDVEDAKDKKKWISPADEGVEDEYCLYDKNNGKLTIKPDHINTNIQIAVRANDYPLLDKLSWQEIDDVSKAGAAKLSFYLGEEKTVTLLEDGAKQNIPYAVRIIDFDKDWLTDTAAEDPKHAGITFDFVNKIADFSTHWNDKNKQKSTNYNFINCSNLNDCLQEGGAIYKKIPSDLMKIIKMVNKEVDIHLNGTWTVGNYNTKLFPLSHDEIDAYVNDNYAYYKKVEHREKGFDYWLRSPITDDDQDIRAWYVQYGGTLHSSVIFGSEFAVVPAFCI